ncbi:MAG: bifunctional adenosylcobinamide kinase/adenosylcobinamide-phosphate guanylyltransferase [Anaerolineae bacterium]
MKNKPELTLVLGGARAGKSDYAEQLVAGYGPRVLYVATAEVKDEEMRARVQMHRARRNTSWTTLEAPAQVGAALLAARPAADAILLDCLTLLVTNLVLAYAGDEEMVDPVDEEAADAAVAAEIEALLKAQTQLGLPMVVVSNEVGLGVVPPYPLGRLYRDVLGRANQRLAAIADRVYLLIAGLPMTLKGNDPGY